MKTKLRYCLNRLLDHGVITAKNYYKAEKQYEEKYSNTIHTIVDFNKFKIKKCVEE